jgi:hypothetical protein
MLKYFHNIIICLQVKVVFILRHGIGLNRLVIKYNLISNQIICFNYYRKIYFCNI